MGLVLNLRFMEMLDFVLGWSTLDIVGDDGKKLGKWPWQRQPATNLPKRPKLPF